jgi:hypothetical protein
MAWPSVGAESRTRRRWCRLCLHPCATACPRGTPGKASIRSAVRRQLESAWSVPPLAAVRASADAGREPLARMASGKRQSSQP